MFVSVCVTVSAHVELRLPRGGDKWSITFKVMIKTQTINFEIGKEFSDENPMLGGKSKVGALIKL